MAITLRRTKNASPPRILLHGGPKAGKSTFAAGLPRPVFLPAEDGLSGLDVVAIVENYVDPADGQTKQKSRLETFQEFLNALSWLEVNLQHYDSAVIDSLDWLEQLIIQFVCDTHKVKAIGAAAGGYGKGYEEVFTHWRDVIKRLDALTAKGKIICCICHSKAVKFEDPMHDPYDIWELKLYASAKGQGALTLCKEWADVIGFVELKRFTATNKETKQTKVTETGERILHVVPGTGYLAGNRYGITAPLHFSWEGLRQAMFPPTQQ